MLNQEGKYMQVEHFYPKSRYPEKVLEWGNLLPCINVCNSKKKDCNPAKTPIVNPLFDNPKDYFYVHNGRIFPLNPKCDKAINTIEKCDLNNDRQFRQTRYQIEMQIKAHLEIIRTAYAANPKHACNVLKFLMSDSGRHSSYSATRSTYILKDKNYLYLRSVFIDRKIWENDFLPLEKELIFCSLPYSNSI